MEATSAGAEGGGSDYRGIRFRGALEDTAVAGCWILVSLTIFEQKNHLN